MNARQRRFCDEYLIDQNATQAAVRAGYSEKTAKSQGQRLLTNVDISAYIAAELEKMHSERIADAGEVMEYLTAVMRGAERDQTLRLTGDGVQEVVSVPVPTRDRVRAAELLGKRYSLFTDRADLNVARPIVISGGEALED